MSIFADSLLSLSKILTQLRDPFYFSKLDQKTKKYIDVYVSYLIQADKKPTLIQIINELIDCLEFIEHGESELKNEILNCKKNILQFKIELYRKQVKTEKDVSRKETKPKRINNFKGNKERILEFIGKTQQVRPKDILDEFNLVPQRTIKRNLKELLSAGLISKMNEENAVYYSSNNK